MARERWGSKLGVILAVAGSAVGLGNFLRFPGEAAQHGGGAFMIPYFIALVLLGLPLMWVEWTIGRFGGGFGHSTAPGAFQTMWNKNRFIKYFGVIGIFGPVIIFIYYVYIESWLLGYSVFAATGKYAACTTKESIGSFLGQYIGGGGEHFGSMLAAYGFFLLTFVINIVVVYYGLKGGIERLCKWAMPALFVLAIVLVVRVFTLGTPDAAHPDRNISNGLGYLWNPDMSKLADPGQWSAAVSGVGAKGEPLGVGGRLNALAHVIDADMWLAAAGQIFFTLSVGIGAILTYASYLRKEDDVALAGLTSATVNEFAEVILGASIVIPAAFVLLGGQATADFAKGGTFSLGFLAMPLVLEQLPGSQIFGFAWFFLLFLAGITSSVSLSQPAVAFLEDEFNLTKREAVLVFGVTTFILCQAVVFGGVPVIDEVDFWAVNFCLVVFALVEAILFAWVFGMQRAWTELHSGSDIRIPGFYRFVIKYITPLLLLAILGTWAYQKLGDTILLKGVPPAEMPVRIMTRVMLLFIFAILCLLVWSVWRRRNRQEQGELA
ncbi:MAG: sodium:calcium symporter [Planctomycetaceae bacterium]|nr:sodium:calcium symporter [Planctomycetaceae bacterium]